ncbi:MAG: carboxypeptidase regulatory-like domain-containing protein, partial [Chitinophagaceae bacterium]|nr:carboxypeptidase regulatory-like domain-containing protein [Chitinophagaceae bacterium]
MNTGRFYGRIVDEKTDKGVDAASVQLISSKGGKDTVIAGMLTKKSGDFSLENLPVIGRFRLNISAIGYKTFEKQVAFDLKSAKGKNPSQMMAALDKDLGNIKLEIDTQVLSSVVVTASKPMMQMGIDRKIFNVDKNITST